MSPSLRLLLLPLLLLATHAAAHGFVSQVSIAGKPYNGNVPNGETDPSIIRQIKDISPVKGASNPDLFCGLGSQVASEIADANPGDTIGVKWVGGGGENWPHNTGPMLTYLASCGSTPCTQLNPNTDTTKWFKIQQESRTSPGGPWTQAALMDASTNVVYVKLPSNLAPGSYLLRHEIIALHLAVDKGGAEFYPACAQIKVGGQGTGQPEQDELVTFPGAYSDTDPGIFDPNVFDVNAPYTFPGPQIAKFVEDGSSGSSNSTSGSSGSNSTSGSGSNSGSNGSGSGPNDSGTGSTNPQAALSGSSKKCRLTKRSSSFSSDSTNTGIAQKKKKRSSFTHHQDIVHLNIQMYKPKHLSRVMKSLFA
ncbi:hypothetical protein K435DRAFT_785850 [Dendrothele bispora CBS 962.96]|uniref:lytic cellulose monooxygenase (C4-dehydrogenating) n=1 Tax=Dendrothele bispora (strain CBS 962.96) TaxID=1314807 RepID=A0A4S8KUI9_DENBC|nr:hypothetical protein K435DRAFT_785850 [Dendrothele bispora CBS 962.96]